VRRVYISAAPTCRALQAPNIHVITEFQALYALKEENYLCECLNAIEELLLCTQNDTPCTPVSMPEPLGFESNSPPPPPLELTPLFKEPKIGKLPTFSGKASEFDPFLA